MPDHKAMPTTTLLVETPVDFTTLDQQFMVIKYDVPQKFRFLPNSGYQFRRLHTALKEQFAQPYHFYSYDTPAPSILSIYAPGEAVQEITLHFLDSQPLPWQRIAWNDIELHLVVKLLQATYFKSTSSAAFASQNKYYIQAKPDGSGVICLQVAIKGAMKNPDLPPGVPQEFKVTGHATRFIRTDTARIIEERNPMEAYFGRMSPKAGQAFFRQLAPSEIESYTGDVYRIFTDRNNPASLNYHQQQRPEYARGYILYTFLKSFTQYLLKYGVVAQQKVRLFTQYKVRGEQISLPIKQLGTIMLLDNRLNKTTVPFAAYHELLSTAYPELPFQEVATLSPETSAPVLILQDHEADDFTEEGRLAAYPDPYPLLYKTYRHVPKQSININPNTAAEMADATAYLSYGVVALNDPDTRYDLRFDACLNELYLKNIVMHPESFCEWLPGFPAPVQPTLFVADQPEPYAFIRKKTYHTGSYWTLLYFNGPTLTFVDLRDPQGRTQLYTLLDRYELDWEDDVIDPFNRKYRKEGRSEDAMKRYDFILASHTVIELEDIEEQVLYEYNTIIARQEDLDRQYPIAHFKLLPAHDRTQGEYSQVALESAELNGEHAQATLAQEATQLHHYDAFLDTLAQTRTAISFNDLTSGERMQEIAQIFGITPTTNGRYPRSRLKSHYQRRGQFLSDKGVDVQAYSGIWYDEEHCVMVGSPTGLKAVQARAQRIRQFDVYRSPGTVAIQPLLDMMAVKFVRHQQYTVYPYFFHLIDLYVTSVLLHDRGESLPSDT